MSYSHSVYAVLSITLNPDLEAEYLRLMEEFIVKIRLEEKNISYNLLKIQNEECRYYLIGCWSDERGIQEHFESEHFQYFTPILGNSLEYIKADICDIIL